MQILLANPRGFCAGVDRAISIVERALELYGAPGRGRESARRRGINCGEAVSRADYLRYGMSIT